MKCIRNFVLALLVAFLCGISGWAQTGSPRAGIEPEQALHAVHDALFASFLPIDELPDDPKATALLTAARDGMWHEIGETPALQQMLAPFADLSGFGEACGIAHVIDGAGASSFASLTKSERRQVLLLMQNCTAPVPRRLAATVRNFYIVKGYGAVQGDLTGIQINLFAPPAYLKTHSPQLPPSRLIFDNRKKELVERDGHPIDVLVIGSGPAGSVVAHELRRGGKRVLLLERGSFVIPGAMETRLIDDLIDTRTTVDGGIRVRNGMAVGGGTQVNVDLCFAPTSEAIRLKIESWRKAGRIAPDEFTQAELAREYAWVKRMIGTRTLSENEINLNNHVLWDGARLSGLHPKLYNLNTYPPGRSPSPVTDKRSAESQLLVAALEDRDNPLGMIPDADVRRILLEGTVGDRHAIGVEVRMRQTISETGAISDPNHLKLPVGEVFTVHAKTIILCAGALGSPTILLRSGLNNDQIGRGVILHPSVPIMGRFDHHIDVLNGTEASVYVDDHLADHGYAFESMADQPLYAAIMSPGSALHTYEVIKSFRDLAGFGVMLVDTPKDTNRVLLDEDGAPQIEYALSDGDKQRLAEGISEGIRIMFKAGAKEVYIPSTENILGGQIEGAEFRPQILTSADQATLVEKNLQFIPNRTLISSAHMQATDKMGSTPQGSVVAQDFHVWGTRNLYVVDASIFPTSIGANPMQSVYTIAKIFADHWNAAY